MSNKKNRNRLKDQRKEARDKEKAKKQRMIGVMIGTIVFILLCVLIGLAIYQSQKPKEEGASSVHLSIKEQPVLGDKNAPVTLVEFGDYRCIYCKQFQEEILPRLKSEYIDTGKVKLAFINFTILGEESKLAANAGEAIYHDYPDHFWDFHDALYKNQGDESKPWVSIAFLEEIAKQTVPNLDIDRFESDLKNRSYQSVVQRDYDTADKIGLSGTPDLLINGEIVDPFDYSKIKSSIEAALKEAE